MRISLFIGLLLFFCIANAQEIEVVNASEATYHGNISDEIRVPLRIKNVSDKPVYIFVKRIDNKIGSTQATNFCWGDECYDNVTDKLPISKRIEPGQTTEEFVSVLNTGLVTGFSTVRYQIYTRGNPSNVIEHELTYVVEDQQRTSTLFSSDDLILNEVYPNPVKEYAFIDYQVNNPDTEAKIIVHNVLGSVVGDFILNPLEKELKIPAVDYNPGVYFYTLYVDGDGVITKKLVIRR